MHRQHREKDIPSIYIQYCRSTHQILADVPVGKHYAFGNACSSGGEKQNAHFIGIYFSIYKASVSSFDQLFSFFNESFPRKYSFAAQVRTAEAYQNFQFCVSGSHHFFKHLFIFFSKNYCGNISLYNQLLKFFCREFLIQRDHNSGAADCRQITCSPLIAVFPYHRNSLSLKSAGYKSRSQSVDSIQGFAVGDLTERFILFKFLPESNIIAIKLHAGIQHVLQVCNRS